MYKLAMLAWTAAVALVHGCLIMFLEGVGSEECGGKEALERPESACVVPNFQHFTSLPRSRSASDVRLPKV